MCFFFSSRRRHTRLQGDWSSDVCSSDLHTGLAVAAAVTRRSRAGGFRRRVYFSISGRGPIQRRSRSEERRVGEEGRSRWAPYHLKKKNKKQPTSCRRSNTASHRYISQTT